MEQTTPFGSITMGSKMIIGLIATLIIGMGFPISTYASAQYPLKLSTDKRYLVDQNNIPFLMYGDSPQGILKLPPSDQETYLSSRQTVGINTLWVGITCSPYSSICPDEYTYLGSTVPPFTNKLSDGSYDFSTPNELYFAQTDAMINRAKSHGMTVLLDILETGWWLPMVVKNNSMIESNGKSKAYNFGVYVGNRYKNFPNIIWLFGNDFQTWGNTTDDAAILAMADGVRSADSSHIITVELDYDTSGSLDDSRWVSRINLDTSYSYYPAYYQTLLDYNRASNMMPVYYIEGVYEFQSIQGGYPGAYSLRNQEYWSQLSGSTGQLYGNFNLYGFPPNWKSSGWETTTGIKEFGIWYSFFVSRPWYALVPDQNHSVLTGGYGTYSTCCLNANSDYATTARTVDGNLVISYLPTRRTVTIDMSKLSGAAIARWFDPTTGQYTSVSELPLANTGSRQFSPPTSLHNDGKSDWLLVLEISPSPSLAPSPSPKPGDADGNGKVDGVDYVTWFNHYNQVIPGGNTVGDFDTSGKVDGVDYTIWFNNYGK